MLVEQLRCLVMDRVIDAERALLGAVLSDAARQHSVLRFVQSEDFYRPWHGQVLAATRRVAGRGVVPGPLEVYAELKQDPDLPLSVSHDAVLVADLMEACPRASHAAAYAGLVIGARARRELGLAGGRMRQAAEAPEAGPAGDEVLEQARLVVSRARRDLAASRRRWAGLPEVMRRELPVPARETGADAEIARRAGRVRDELARLREDLWAQPSDHVAGRLAVIARQLAENAADSARTRQGDAGHLAARPAGAAAEAAGMAALRDLVAEPRLAAEAAGWLEPGHFAAPAQGTVFRVIADLRRAGLPVDPVTVCWEAGRRGADVDPRSLAGGCGAFAAVNMAQVYRRAALARLDRAGLDLQSDAADWGLTTERLFQRAGERLRGAEHDLAPERCQMPARHAEVVELPVHRGARLAGRPGAERGMEAAP